MSFEFEYTDQDTTRIVRIQGNLVLRNIQEINKILLDSLEEQNVQRLLLDSSQINFIDSSGIALLISCQKQAMLSHKLFGMFSLNTNVQRVFDITRVDQAIPVYPNEAEALSGLQKHTP